MQTMAIATPTRFEEGFAMLTPSRRSSFQRAKGLIPLRQKYGERPSGKPQR